MEEKARTVWEEKKFTIWGWLLPFSDIRDLRQDFVACSSFCSNYFFSFRSYTFGEKCITTLDCEMWFILTPNLGGGAVSPTSVECKNPNSNMRNRWLSGLHVNTSSEEKHALGNWFHWVIDFTEQLVPQYYCFYY